jgi:hypothetical protein
MDGIVSPDVMAFESPPPPRCLCLALLLVDLSSGKIGALLLGVDTADVGVLRTIFFTFFTILPFFDNDEDDEDDDALPF